MAKRSGVLTNTAGVYYLAYELASRGFHAAVTHGNAPSVDMLVSTLDGGAAITLQIKTTDYALRTRGRGDAKEPYEYQWDVGPKSASLNRPNLFFAFVDLNPGPERNPRQKPDVFIVPSRVIYKYFDDLWDYFHSGKPRRWRWHPKVEKADRYKNNWDLLVAALEARENNSKHGNESPRRVKGIRR